MAWKVSIQALATLEAVHLLFHRIVIEQIFTLELKLPNLGTWAAMSEIEQMKGVGPHAGEIVRYRRNWTFVDSDGND